MHYLDELNEDQLKAVKTTEGYLRVIAGAGSGKTKLLVSRYVYLVSEYGINPANILCVTFTNKAAREMKQRIKALLGNDFDSSLICTYHGFCARVLREDSDKIFYPKSFQILDTPMQKAILDEIYQKFELKLDHASFEKILKRVSQEKRDLFYVEKMCSLENGRILNQIQSVDDEIVEEYLQRQKRSYALDFNDLLNFTIYLFEKSQEVKEKWQDKLNYIQVDEFQDSSVTELNLIDILSAKYKNLMIVGDPDQNIYEWRGAEVKLLVDFDKTYGNCQTQFLTRNYRSTSKILHCANTLIEKNKYRLKKDLYTTNGQGDDVLYYHESSDHNEAEKIFKIIKFLHKAGHKYSDIAVLYRSSFLSWPIERKFNEEGIPYEIFGGVKFYQRMEIQDIIAYLRLVCFDDDISFKRIINKPRRRFGKTKMQRLMALRQEGESLFDTLKTNLYDDIIKKSDAWQFVLLIEDMRQKVLKEKVAEFVNKLCVNSGYENYIKEMGDMERFDNLAEFKRMVADQEQSEGESLSMEEFLGRIAIQTDEDESTEKDSVKLMTIHASKGLEFPTVFIMGFSESIFPNAKAIEERGELGMEEERRLCYVAITRAKKRLVITDSQGVSPSGKSKVPSRFLKDIGYENFKQFGISFDEKDKEELKLNAKESFLPNLSIGQEVNHPAFGKGEIIEINPSRTSCKIKFEDGKMRDISTRFFSDNPLKAKEKENIKPKDLQEKEKTVHLEDFNQEKVKNKNFLIQPNENKPNPLTKEKTYRHMVINDNFAETGWRCVGVSDYGYPSFTCQFCQKQTVRYVHHMENINGEKMDVGCVCAGKLEGDTDKSRERENKFKSN